MHKVAGPIEAAVSIPFLHPGDATAAAVRRAGITTVGLLGTAFTMEQDFYRDRLATHGLADVSHSTDKGQFWDRKAIAVAAQPSCPDNGEICRVPRRV